MESTEKYFRPINTSWMQLPRARANSAEGEDIFDPQQNTADAANIDNKDDGSWLKKDKQLPWYLVSFLSAAAPAAGLTSNELQRMSSLATCGLFHKLVEVH